MTDTLTPYRSTVPVGRDGFGQSLRAEWTKFRTVRGWVIGTVVALLLMVLFGMLTGFGSRSTYNTGPGTPDIVGHPYIPLGPDGEPITDSFYFVHQALDGDGSVTARITSMTGSAISYQGGPAGPGPGSVAPAELQPWAKAGLIIKANLTQGSAYAAIMVTGGHGVRMQSNYVNDVAGPAGSVSAASPRWLRLTRSGSTITGSTSTDGHTWTTVGTAHLAGLPSTVQAGPFAASPVQDTTTQHLGGGGKVLGSRTRATAAFDGLDRQGRWAGGSWSGGLVQAHQPSADDEGGDGSGFQQSGGTLTVTGMGDIAPKVDGAGLSTAQTLAGTIATLIVVVVLGVLFITTEYRRGLIRTSLTARPRRGQILAAKAIVIGAVTFVVSLIGTAVTVPLTEHLLRQNGNFIYPSPWLTEVRIIVGTAALLALAAVLALALGTIARRSAGAVAAAIVVIVLPFILATAAVLPAGPSEWLLRLTPAAAFAVQQSIPAYPQVDQAYTPAFGFYPLAPWAGLAVLGGYTAVALGAAFYLLRRRDA